LRRSFEQRGETRTLLPPDLPFRKQKTKKKTKKNKKITKRQK